jgi:hypothetical protein
MKQHYEDVLSTRVTDAMQDAWDRLHDVLTRMSERLSDTEDGKRKIFRDSLVENAIEVCGLLRHFNITGDVRMEAMRMELEETMRGIDASVLRESDLTREQTKQKVDAMLDKFSM